jgi:hypothetical protein
VIGGERLYCNRTATGPGLNRTEQENGTIENAEVCISKPDSSIHQNEGEPAEPPSHGGGHEFESRRVHPKCDYFAGKMAIVREGVQVGL